ncbi:hypothetical protein ACOMHN_058112 [Nucella lapillus]
MSSVVLELTSSMSSLMSTKMVTNDVINETATNIATEKPYEEFAEVKIASLIARIYVPFLVSVGLVFNFLCFVTFVFTSLGTTSTCVYMAAIAVLDSIVLVHALCNLIRRYIGHTAFYMHSDWACGLHYFLFYFTIHLDVLVLLAMTVDRFIVVKFPLKAQSWCTPKSAIRVIAGLGIFSFALNFQIFFNRRLILSGNVDDPLRCWYPAGDIENFMEKVYTVIDASIYSFIPFLSLLILNLLIIRQLKQANKFSKQFTENRDTKRTPKAKDVETGSASSTEWSKVNSNRNGGPSAMKKSMTSTNINVMFLLVSFTFLLLTSPIVIVLLYGRHYWKPSTNPERAQFSLTLVCVEDLMFSNHGVNFLLYCISGRRFREELKRLLNRFCSRL